MAMHPLIPPLASQAGKALLRPNFGQEKARVNAVRRCSAGNQTGDHHDSRKREF